MQKTAFLLFVLFLSLLTLCNTQDVHLSTEPGTDSAFCHWTSPTLEGNTRLVFLHKVSTGNNSLYLSVWSKNNQLLRCALINDQFVIGNYKSLCRRVGSRWNETQRFDLSILLRQKNSCALHFTSEIQFFNQKETDESERPHLKTDAKVRRKRAWLFPGTLWCGSGNKAVEYQQLGMFELADRCCREHDHCTNVIPAFTVNYGVFNPNFYTVSHCGCDQRFRQCLVGVNDTISNMVGYSFFNILRVPCFKLSLRTHCTELHWWGWCKVSKEAPYAVFEKPLPYNSTSDSNIRVGNSQESNGTDEQLSKEKPKKKHPKAKKTNPLSFSRQCDPRNQSKGDTYQLKRRKGKGCSRGTKSNKTLAVTQPVFTTSETHTTIQFQTTIPSTLITPIEMITSITTIQKTHMTTSISNAATTTSKKKKAAKNKKVSKSESMAYQKQRSPPETATQSYQKTQSTTQSYQKTQSTTQRTKHVTLDATLQTTTTLVPTNTTHERKKRPWKKRHRCGPRILVRGDNFQPRSKGCLESENKQLKLTNSLSNSEPLMLTATQSTKMTTISPTERTSPSLWRASRLSSLKPITTLLALTTQYSAESNQSFHGFSANRTNLSAQDSTKEDRLLLCETLKYLDECKHKIAPLQKKHGHHNMEQKTLYHCNCTTRLAGLITNLKISNTLHSLLMDYVSMSCFKLPNEKACHTQKSCDNGFFKASELLQILKNMKEMGKLGVQETSKGRKRGIPFRLQKRCLRITELGIPRLISKHRPSQKVA